MIPDDISFLILAKIQIVGTSKKYPQSVFRAKKKGTMYIPVYTGFTI